MWAKEISREYSKEETDGRRSICKTASCMIQAKGAIGAFLIRSIIST